MSRSNIGIPKTYVIVGLDNEGVEHFIGSSCGEGFIKTWINSLKFRFKKRYRERYNKIHVVRLDLF